MHEVVAVERQTELETREETQLFGLINFASRIRNAWRSAAEITAQAADVAKRAYEREARLRHKRNRAALSFLVAVLVAMALFGASESGLVANELYHPLMVADLLLTGWLAKSAWLSLKRWEAAQNAR